MLVSMPEVVESLWVPATNRHAGVSLGVTDAAETDSRFTSGPIATGSDSGQQAVQPQMVPTIHRCQKPEKLFQKPEQQYWQNIRPT